MVRIKHVLNRIKNKLLNLYTYKARCVNKNAILLDTPEHGNLGDHAIALAEQQVLQEMGIKYVEVTAGELDKLENLYAKLTPIDYDIVIHGGGFLGEIWPEEEYRFRRILKAFKNHKIIVFPQTLTFDMNSEEGIAFFNESKQAYISHNNLKICVREKMSLEFMNTYMPEIEVILCPDIVTLLQTESHVQGRDEILLCMRGDREKALSDEEMDSILKTIKQYYPNEKLRYTDTIINKSITPKERKHEVATKLDEFSKSRLVITDRLHGMIFAVITRTPCIAFGNSNGKVKAVYEWIEQLPYIIFANNVDELDNLMRQLDLSKECSYDRMLIKSKFDELYAELFQEEV